METRPIFNKDYQFEERTVRFMGPGKNIRGYIFRDTDSGAFVILNPRDLDKLKERE